METIDKKTAAMKQALEALNSFPHRHLTPFISDARTTLREALAQPQQEPVAWAISYDGKTPYAIWPDGDGALLDLEVKRQGGTTCKLPLYTFPPARKPLTDEQIDAAVKAWFENEIVAGRQPFAKRIRAAVEAAHGIKGEA